jgi:hypothetical protein
MLTRRILPAAIVALLVAPAAEAASPKRVWYRIETTAEVVKAGDFTFGLQTEHRVTRVKLRLKSRAAVLLYHQCTALGIDKFDPKRAARLVNFNLAAVDCAQTRAFMRRVGYSRSEIGKAQLVDDVRFTAKGEGFADEFERRSELPARNAGTPAAPIDCPPQALDVVRTTAPAPVEGTLATASAVRDGVSVVMGAPKGLLDNVAIGSEGGPCIVRANGSQTRVPRLVVGPAPGPSVFGWRAGYGFLPPAALVRFRIGRRFGQSFDVDGGGVIEEPLANGTWRTSGVTDLHFKLCPRGGRDVSGC